MFRSFLYRILEKRHFWRYATFGEIADLYAAQTLRVAAISLVSGFSSVFLYRQGYSLVLIIGFWAVYFCSKIFVAPLAGFCVAKLGVTKSTIISNIMYIPAMLSLSFVTLSRPSLLISYGIFLSMSVALHELCYFVEFSRVKSVEHAGKEIGFMNILEKIVICASPVIGGFIASCWGIQVTIWLAGFILALAGLPLMKIKDKSEKRHSFDLVGFPWRLVMSSLVGKTAIGFDIFASSIVWGLFVATVLLPLAGNEIYATLGLLSSLTVVVAIVTSSVFGRLIDNSKGGNLLKVGVAVNVIGHLSRTVVSTPLESMGVNVVNEVASTAQGMSFVRGMFDIADTSGHRVMYLVLIDAVNSLGAMIACLVMLGCLGVFTGSISFRVFYAITALVCSSVALVRFRLYRKG